MYAISNHLLTSVHHERQYSWGWPPLRFTAKWHSETQEYMDFLDIFYVGAVHMSRASPANRADLILSQLTVA